jgi:hypothetical protein
VLAVLERRLTAGLSADVWAGESAALVSRLLSVGVALAAAAAAVILVSQFSYVFVFDAEVGGLNADAENNAFSWMSTVTTFCGAFAALLVAFAGRNRNGRFLALALVLAFFSFDDAVQVHETIGTDVAESIFGEGTALVHALWPVLFFPLLAFAFLLLWDVSRELPPRAGLAVRIGLGLLVLGVFLEGAASAWYESGEDAENFVGALEIGLEEGAELAGWILVVTGLTARACLSLAGLHPDSEASR